MTWPPVKAWTSIAAIDEQVHFVAINYGGKLLNRWVIMMSVIDSSVVVKVSWPKLINSSNWEAGWKEKDYVESALIEVKSDVKNTELSYPSNDSGLTMPISKETIRPWF
tara:strand:- start:953 stop:1279 length:327 start_codon:yes stop_codon:yes gene_type:complete